ncbi:TolC family protein [Rhodocytophaga aerolata]|uniref:TolC family protein n=1 Tax=Rhodocytophaga aerolata TaxID=455078 RepID=A0ABT8R8H0_9BACT|nr:TolC family protein [Rhodocytophaga aerolata]MDO1448400.1 TolC family protein [Rhodocytophaga aerolata]
MPTTILPDFTDLSSGRRVAVQTGVANTSNVLLQADQTLYSNDVLLASKAARYSRLQFDQNTENTKINTVVNVSKAFYDIIFSQEQLRILDENITRQQKQYADARARYNSGLVDKTDYQRASISIANTRASRKRTEEAIKAKYAMLKELMGVPIESDFDIQYDNNVMQQDMQIDTTQSLVYTSRVEYRQLQTQKNLLQLNTSYYKWGFVPTVSAFINYNWVYQNNEFAQLYDQVYPTSVVGLSARIPIFQGTRRLHNLKKAQLQEKSLDLEVENARNSINTEFQAALANYKSDYNEYLTLQENAQIAEEVYNTIKLQYDEGIKAYVDLIVAETDLQTAQINYYNALYRVLASRLDYERALGKIDIN